MFKTQFWMYAVMSNSCQLIGTCDIWEKWSLLMMRWTKQAYVTSMGQKMHLPIIKSIFGIMVTTILCVLVCVGNISGKMYGLWFWFLMYNYHKVKILPVYTLFEIQHKSKNQTSLSVKGQIPLFDQYMLKSSPYLESQPLCYFYSTWATGFQKEPFSCFTLSSVTASVSSTDSVCQRAPKTHCILY